MENSLHFPCPFLHLPYIGGTYFEPNAMALPILKIVIWRETVGGKD